jgi:hypothetical protein
VYGTAQTMIGRLPYCSRRSSCPELRKLLAELRRRRMTQVDGIAVGDEAANSSLDKLQD